jgi:hypothetical protein
MDEVSPAATPGADIMDEVSTPGKDDIMDEVSPAATPGTTPRRTPGTTPRGSAAPSTPSGATLPGTPPAEPSVAGSPPGTPPAEAPPSDAGTELLPEMWGHFRIQVKRPCLDAPYGGYVAICRYHALHANYGCQLSRSMQDNTDEQREAVLNMMRHWCNMAPRYDRQHKHVYSRIQLASTPSPAVVRAQVLIDPPPVIVKTDAEFKAEAAALLAPAVPVPEGCDRGRGGRARGRARGRAGGGRRGRGSGASGDSIDTDDLLFSDSSLDVSSS